MNAPKLTSVFDLRVYKWFTSMSLFDDIDISCFKI